MKPASDDLNRLIGAAEVEVASASLKSPAEKGAPRGTAHQLRLVAVVAALVFAGTQLWPLLHIPSKGRTAEDLDAIIEQARQSVETARAAQGRLPDTLPNAALAGLVAYTPVGNNYQLFISSGGVSVTLEPDGKKTVKQGSAP